jgi:methionyl-tRNA formyltransferase
MPNKINIVFMGTPDYATCILEYLLKQTNFHIPALFTQPDKAVGRKKIITPPHIKQYIIENKIDINIYQPTKLRDEVNIKILKQINPDFIVVAAYGQLLPKDILDIAPCINLHASILPKHRGASPIQQALLDNEKFVGVSAMLMDRGLDTGDILGYKIIKMPKNIFVNDLFDKLSILAKELIINIINDFPKINPIKQTNAISSHTKKIKKEDGEIDFINAKDIYTKYKAYYQWPSIFTKNKIKLTKITLQNENIVNEKYPIIKEITKEYIIISCKIGDIAIYSLQPPSKKEMPSVDYIKGKRLSVGHTIL